MGRKVKPKQVTDKTIEPKAVWSEVSYDKKPKVTYLYNSQIVDTSDFAFTVSSEEIFNMFPWLLDEIDQPIFLKFYSYI